MAWGGLADYRDGGPVIKFDDALSRLDGFDVLVAIVATENYGDCETLDNFEVDNLDPSTDVDG